MSKVEQCRGCRRELRSSSSGSAYDPITGSSVPWGHYGGWVCSEACERSVSFRVESSMPGTGPLKSLSCFAQKSLKDHWEK